MTDFRSRPILLAACLAAVLSTSVAAPRALAQSFGIRAPDVGANMNFLSAAPGTTFTLDGAHSGEVPSQTESPPRQWAPVSGMGFQGLATQADTAASQKLLCIEQLRVKGVSPVDVLKICERLNTNLLDAHSSGQAGDTGAGPAPRGDGAARPVTSTPLPPLVVPDVNAAAGDGRCDVSHNLQALWTPACLSEAEETMAEAKIADGKLPALRTNVLSGGANTPTDYLCRITDGHGAVLQNVTTHKVVDCLKNLNGADRGVSDINVEIGEASTSQVTRLVCHRKTKGGKLVCKNGRN